LSSRSFCSRLLARQRPGSSGDWSPWSIVYLNCVQQFGGRGRWSTQADQHRHRRRRQYANEEDGSRRESRAHDDARDEYANDRSTIQAAKEPPANCIARHGQPPERRIASNRRNAFDQNVSDEWGLDQSNDRSNNRCNQACRDLELGDHGSPVRAIVDLGDAPPSELSGAEGRQDDKFKGTDVGGAVNHQILPMLNNPATSPPMNTAESSAARMRRCATLSSAALRRRHSFHRTSNSRGSDGGCAGADTTCGPLSGSVASTSKLNLTVKALVRARAGGPKSSKKQGPPVYTFVSLRRFAPGAERNDMTAADDAEARVRIRTFSRAYPADLGGARDDFEHPSTQLWLASCSSLKPGRFGGFCSGPDLRSQEKGKGTARMCGSSHGRFTFHPGRGDDDPVSVKDPYRDRVVPTVLVDVRRKRPSNAVARYGHCVQVVDGPVARQPTMLVR
jgi:hypothetical protein